MTPEQYAAMLDSTPLGRASAEFARAREFNPADWEPSTYARDGSHHKKGEPCFRHRTRKSDTRDTLPEGYRVQGNRVVHESALTSVVVPAVRPQPSTPGFTVEANYRAGNPHEVYNAILSGRENHPDAYTHRLQRHALLALADLQADQIHPAVAALIPHAQRLADSPHHIEVVPSLLAAAHTASAAYAFNDPNEHILHALNHVDPRQADGLPPGQHLYRSLRRTGHDLATSPALAPHAAAQANTIRSIFRVGPTLTIPVNRDIIALARDAYNHPDPVRRRATMRVLSDALEEEGAPDSVLANLRNPHSAVRGNWVLDAILGKR